MQQQHYAPFCGLMPVHTPRARPPSYRTILPVQNLIPSLQIPSPRLLPSVLNQVYPRAERDFVDHIFDDFSNTIPARHAHVRYIQKPGSIPEFHRNLASSHGELLHALSYAAFASTLPQQTDSNSLLLQLSGNQGLVSSQEYLN